MEYNVKLDTFEGPLDLLLHLINRLEIDIYDISITQITDQYLAFIHTMQELQLDVAGDYLLMAATLLEMKSNMLLPSRDALDDETLEVDYEGENPKEELIRRLVEYRKYKAAAEDFKEREARSHLLFSKPPSLISETQSRQLHEVSLYDMILSLQKLRKRKQLEVPKKTKIQHKERSVQERMVTIMNELERNEGRHLFTSLYSSSNREEIVPTFLAILELIKNRKITCRQDRNFMNIMVYKMEMGDQTDAAQINH